MINHAAKSPVNVAPFTLYADGSGAPTTVECAGYVYACDWLAGARITLIRPATGSRRQSEIAARRCENAYTAAVTASASPEWLAANIALYTE